MISDECKQQDSPDLAPIAAQLKDLGNADLRGVKFKVRFIGFNSRTMMALSIVAKSEDQARAIAESMAEILPYQTVEGIELTIDPTFERWLGVPVMSSKPNLVG